MPEMGMACVVSISQAQQLQEGNQHRMRFSPVLWPWLAGWGSSVAGKLPSTNCCYHLCLAAMPLIIGT